MDELPLSKKVVQIAVGLKHTLALTEDQEVYSWGKGPALGHFDLESTLYNLLQSLTISRSISHICH